jgi:tetratricopeptide (TPR) repeat protein
VSDLLVGLLGALLATNQPVAVSNLVQKTSGLSAPAVDPNDPVEKEYEKLLELDDSSQAEVDQLIRGNEVFAAEGAPAPEGTLRDRIHAHFAPVRKAYEDFLKRHPEHARARLAYGSFLNDIKDEDGAHDQWEKARQLDPKNPAAWNNLANYYGHNGPVTNAFNYYAKAIELDPNEPVYYHNFGTTVYLFRQDAMAHFKISEQQVLDKALELYARALQLDPQDFPLATDIAQTFYGIRPTRTREALLAWNYALKIARDDIEREGVYVHLARIKLNAGQFDEARRHLNAVTNAMYVELKQRVLRNLESKEAQAKGTNAPPASAANASVRPGEADKK